MFVEHAGFFYGVGIARRGELLRNAATILRRMFVEHAGFFYGVGIARRGELLRNAATILRRRNKQNSCRSLRRRAIFFRRQEILEHIAGFFHPLLLERREELHRGRITEFLFYLQ